MGLQIFAFNVWKHRKEEYRNILVVKEYGKHAVKETCPEVFGNPTLWKSYTYPSSKLSDQPFFISMFSSCFCYLSLKAIWHRQVIVARSVLNLPKLVMMTKRGSLSPHRNLPLINFGEPQTVLLKKR